MCVSKLTIVASDNGLLTARRQAIIQTNADLLSIGILGTNFSEFWIKLHMSSFMKMHLKMSPVKWRPFCLNVLRHEHNDRNCPDDIVKYMSCMKNRFVFAHMLHQNTVDLVSYLINIFVIYTLTFLVTWVTHSCNKMVIWDFLVWWGYWARKCDWHPFHGGWTCFSEQFMIVSTSVIDCWNQYTILFLTAICCFHATGASSIMYMLKGTSVHDAKLMNSWRKTFPRRFIVWIEVLNEYSISKGRGYVHIHMWAHVFSVVILSKLRSHNITILRCTVR